MKSIVQTNIERRVRIESEKKTLVDSYGDLIGWMKVLADWLLAPTGAILDGLVLFGMFYLAVKNVPIAIALAAAAAIFLQFMYGKPAAHAASSLFSGRYDNQGEQVIMWSMWAFTVVAMSFSLYLSFNSDKLVEAVGEQYYQMESDTAINARHDALLATAQQQYNSDVAALQQRIEGLQQDKIMWKGKETVRWTSSQRASELSEQLTTVQQQHNNRVQQIEQQRQQALQQLQQRNTTTADLFTRRIDDGGTALRFINIAFNLFRFLIIVVFMYFAVHAAQQVQQPTTPVATTVVASNNNTTTANTSARVAATAAPKPDPQRTVVRPFSTVLPKMSTTTTPQQPTTPVATNVAGVSTTEKQQAGNTYNVSVVDGEPTLPPPAMMNREKEMTLSEVRRYKGTYKNRKSENGKAIYRELLRMEAVLKQEKGA